MKWLYVIFGTAVISVAATKYYWPTTRIETKEVEILRKDVVTVIKEVVRPDGTKETSTVVTDKSKEDKTAITLQKSPSTWLVSAGAARSFKHDENLYSVALQRRVLGPIWLGVSADTNKTVGIIATLEF